MEITAAILELDAGSVKKLVELSISILREGLFEPSVYTYTSHKTIIEAMLMGRVRVDILVLPATNESYAFAEKLRQLDRNCAIIYLAKNMEPILHAFPSTPIAYIVDENQLYDIAKALIRAAKYISYGKKAIELETKSKILHFALYEIDYFESNYRLVHIVKNNGSMETITARLDDVEALLIHGFHRCHQSYLVNMDNIKFVDKSLRKVVFYSGKSVFASKSLFTDFLNIYKKYRKNSGVIVYE